MRTADLVRKYRHIFNTDWTANANCQVAWLMDVDENPLTDSSGHGITGALTSAGNPDYTASGKFGGGYVFNGDDYIYHSLTPPNGAFTIVAWADWSGSGGENIVGFRSLSNPGIGTYDRCLFINGTKFVFTVYASSDWRQAVSTTSVPASGTWTHVAGTIDTVNGNSIWVNGVEETINASGTNGYNSYNDPILLSGGTEALTPEISPYSGKQDEIATFSITLDSTEINEIYENGLKGATGGGYTAQVIIIT